MKLPFTVEEFLKVFERYNLSIWPVQYGLALLAIAAFLPGFKKTSYSTKLTVIILSSLWLWMGIAYHLIFFTVINKTAYLFGVAFIIQGILFFKAGFLNNQFSFQFKKDIFGITGLLFILFSLVVYPLIGYFMGHRYPSSPTFGLPCPTTIFTFGMLLWTNKKCPVYILIIPVLWSVIGFGAALSLGIKEDFGLIIAGLVAVMMILLKNKKIPISLTV